MADIYRSTNKIAEDQSPRMPRELYRGRVTISGFSALSTGFGAFATVNFDEILTDKIIPDFRAVHFVLQGGGQFEWRQIPYTDINVNGDVRVSVSARVNNILVGGGREVLQLQFNYFTRENNISIRDSAYYQQQVDFVIYSNDLFRLTE